MRDKSGNYKDLVMKQHEGKSVGLIPLVVFLLATGCMSFVLASLIKVGGFSWQAAILLVAIAGAVVVGAGIAYFTIGARPAVHQIRTKLTHAKPVVVKDYRLAYATRRSKGRAIKAINKVSGVIVKVSNGDACPHRVAVDVDINDAPVNRVIREVDIDPGATTYVAVTLPRKFPLEDIDSLIIVLHRTL